MTSPRKPCPDCGKDVATRRDGTARTHLPPHGREDLLCERHPSWPHCEGSHEEPAVESVKIRATSTPEGIAGLLAAITSASPEVIVTHGPELRDVVVDGRAKQQLRIDLEIAKAGES